MVVDSRPCDRYRSVELPISDFTFSLSYMFYHPCTPFPLLLGTLDVYHSQMSRGFDSFVPSVIVNKASVRNLARVRSAGMKSRKSSRDHDQPEEFVVDIQVVFACRTSLRSLL